jgi:nucleotide-binding universal stress UspA family protein
MFRHVLCAVDSSDATAKVLRHAAGVAAVAGARWSVVHVSSEPEPLLEDEWRRRVVEAIPYSAAYVSEPDVHIVTGPVAAAIVAQADRTRADLIVCGTRGRGPVASRLLGSTSRSLLESTSRAVLLIPESDIEIVTLGEARAVLHPGAVIAAVDFGEHHAAQLQLASITAAIAHQPLILMTVLSPGDASSDHDAAAALRQRAHKLTPVRPDAVIVRRGDVAEEIARCSWQECAGLVVMGLRAGRRGQRPGAIARAVLERHGPAVLAVPAAAIGD